MLFSLAKLHPDGITVISNNEELINPSRRVHFKKLYKNKN